MRVTLRDIAERTSLSRVTVCQILGGGGNVMPETRRRVIETARELGYTPNSAARAMRKGRFDTVGLLLRDEAYNIELPAQTIGGIASTLEKKGLKTILVKASNESLLKANSLPGISAKFMLDGAIVSCWGVIPDELRKLAETLEYPVCWVNSDTPHNAVRPDDHGAGRMAAEHLIGLGHRRIAYVDFSGSQHFSTDDRCRGYSDGMIAAGLEPWVFRRRIPSEQRFDGAAELFAPGERPSAVVTYCTYDAMPVIFRASQYGLRVPRDLSVVTIDGRIPVAMGIPISAVIFPEREIGVAAAEMLLARIEARGRAFPSVTVPFKEIAGKTCGPPAHAGSLGGSSVSSLPQARR